MRDAPHMMRRRLLVSIAIAASCMAWCALPASDSTSNTSASQVDHGIDPASTQVELVEPPASEKGAESSGGTRVIAQSMEVMEQAPEATLDDPSDGKWLAGIVEFPPGTPADERAFVSAFEPPISDSIRSPAAVRYPVGPDGRFRVRIPDCAWSLELDVHGRFTYTRSPLTVNVRDELPSVVLRPQLGACVSVRVVPSDQSAARGVGLVRASLARQRHDDGLWIEDFHLTAITDERGVGEVGGLDTEYSWGITASALGTTRSTFDVHALQPGELREIVIALEAAPQLSGNVRDERGAPIHGARIRLSAGMHGARSAFATTGGDGSFSTYVPETGATRMSITCSGFADLELGPWDTTAGTDIASLDITLSGGAEITGVVHWPASSAANSGRVFVQRGAGDAHCQLEGIVVQKDGTFSVLAIAHEPCTIRATVRARIDPSDPKSPYGMWTANVVTSAPAADLVLIPSPGSALRGRVVDELGEPVPEAEVWSIPVGYYGADFHPKCVTDANGAFLLRPVPDGPWTLYAGAPGHAFAQPVEVDMPVTGAIELVVSRTGTIAGRVVDARGDTVGGADVELEAADEASAWRKYFPSTKSAGDGTFRIERVPVGTHRISARRKGHARSLGTLVTTTASETTSGVELALRDGGTIDARVLDDDGTPIVAEEVRLHRAGTVQPSARVQTDELGWARFEHVDPGTVYVMPPNVRGRKSIAFASVVVEDGRTTSIVLRH